MKYPFDKIFTASLGRRLVFHKKCMENVTGSIINERARINN